MPNIAINPSQSPLQNVLNLVDQLNTGGPTSPTQVTAVVPSATTDPDDASVNTQLVLTAIEGQGFTGEVTIEYGRLSLAAEAAAPTGGPTVNANMTAAQMLAEVVSYYGFIASEVSWVSAPTPPESYPATTTPSIQSSGSLVYEDGQTEVSLNWTAVNTAVLLHFDGANGATSFNDAASGTVVTLSNGATLSNAQSKFGGTSMLINGTNAVANMPNTAAAKLSGEFTIEWFSYLTAESAVMWVYGKDSLAVNSGAPAIAYGTGGQIAYCDDQSPNLNGGASNAATSNTGVLVTNQWQHIAFVQHDGVATIYVDGVAVGSGDTSGHTFGNNNDRLNLGNYVGGGFPLLGYMDEFRLSSIARYTENFTPPTTPFTLD
jgi:hypothetical protein